MLLERKVWSALKWERSRGLKDECRILSQCPVNESNINVREEGMVFTLFYWAPTLKDFILNAGDNSFLLDSIGQSYNKAAHDYK